MPIRALLLTAVVVALALTLEARQQQTTFKAGTRTVAAYATVTDAIGRLVADLRRDDFEIYDNGKRQEIAVFANEIQPITVVMLLDRSGSMRTNFGLVEQAAAEFVEEMQPADKARIGSFSNRIQLDPRDFTADRDVLYRILRTELQPEGPTPLWNAVNVGITALLHQHGRRVILVFTDGVDRPMNSAAQNVSLRDAMKRAEEENTIVYAIGLAGENSPVGGGAWRGPTGRGPGGRGPGGWPGGRGPGGPGPRSGRPFGRQGARSAKPDEGLSKIAAATGGGYFELTSTHDLGATFQRVADELHHQYALGFTPAVLDGKTHQLEVRVRRTGMSARARRSYVASPER